MHFGTTKGVSEQYEINDRNSTRHGVKEYRLLWARVYTSQGWELSRIRNPHKIANTFDLGTPCEVYIDESEH